MNPGDDLRFTVDDLDDDGYGVTTMAPLQHRGAAAGGRSPTAPASAANSSVPPASPPVEVHVQGALPGEEISARVQHLSTHRPVAWASLRTIHRVSPDRVAPVCRAHGRCGGCVLQHMDGRAQLAWKEGALRRRVAADPVLGAVPIRPAVPSPHTLAYRNNSKLVAGRDASGRLILGAYAPRSHDIVDLAGCAITEAPLEATAAELRDVLTAHSVEPYDEIRRAGTLRYAVLRANARGQVLVTLVTATDAFPAGDSLAATLKTRRPEVIGVVQNVNPSRGNAIFGILQRTLLGDPTIEDQIGGVRLRVSSRAFFQANRLVAEAAYQAIVEGVAPTASETIVDAYAGVGGIALTLARTAGSVVGIEEHPAAVNDASASAVLNGLPNVRFVAGDVALHLGTLGSADVVVLNPPRTGCATAVLEQTATLAPRTIAYLSCSPPTLLRDLAVLAKLGYRTKVIAPFDMLPHTAHLETLAILVR